MEVLRYKLTTPIQLEAVDGSILQSGNVTHYTFITLIYNSYYFRFKFYLLNRTHSPIILGLDWLQYYNPTIDWIKLKLTLKSTPKYPSNCTSKYSNYTKSKIIETIPEELEDSENTIKNNHSTAIKYLISSTRNYTIPPGNIFDNPAKITDDKIPDEDIVRQQLPKEYRKYATVFSKAKSELLPEHRPYDISIDIQADKTVPWGPIYPLSVPELEVLRTYIDDNLRKGYIRVSKSPAGAPIFFVKKKSGELRPVIDYRGLNEVTVKNKYPLPLIHELLTRFTKARIFSKIDLCGAYNLVRIKDGDEWKTAFCCRFGHYEYRVMPFGLTNAPAVFQGLMNTIFRDILDIYCVIYLDNILIYSEDATTHTTHVQEVLQRLGNNALYAKLEKCKFTVSSVEFLGYIISDKGIKMDPKWTASISNWPPPKCLKELQSLLGFTNFYCMFIPNYSASIQPLLQLLKKDTPYIWSDRM